MKLNCPYCNKELDIMELSHDSDLLAVIKMLNAFGAHSGLVCAYTELFGIAPLKKKTKKWRVLLEEIIRLFDAGKFIHQKKVYRISQAGIVEALNLVVHRNFSDRLENHNYLKKIMIGIADREASTASREAEKQLRQKEDRLMADAERPIDSGEIETNLQRVRSLLKKIG